MKTITYISLFILFPMIAFAQENNTDDFFSNIGKIYVVAAVMLLLFGTMIAFMIYLERKLARIEKMLED